MENKVCLFYYAGHGFEYKGNNYLCPVDANIDKIEESNIDISNMVNEVSKDRDFVCIVILDCCRNIFSDQKRGIRDIKPIAANFKNEGGLTLLMLHPLVKRLQSGRGMDYIPDYYVNTFLAVINL